MDKKECLHYYMLYNGKNISEAHLYDLSYSTGIKEIPPLYKIVDRRTRYAEHYVYCPKCGSKLDWNKFKRMADAHWDYSVGVYDE
jgi:hypothetical protein